MAMQGYRLEDYNTWITIFGAILCLIMAVKHQIYIKLWTAKCPAPCIEKLKDTIINSKDLIFYVTISYKNAPKKWNSNKYNRYLGRIALEDRMEALPAIFIEKECQYH